MSETPRTDAAAVRVWLESEDGFDTVVSADFARQLERELAEAYERAANVCEQMRDRDNTDKWTITRGMAFHECAAAIRALKPSPSSAPPDAAP